MLFDTIITKLKKIEKITKYIVMPIEKKSNIYIGIDCEERPCIFIGTQEKMHTPAIRTSQVKVEFAKEYKLSIGKKIEKEGLFHAIFCLSNNPIDISAFKEVLNSLLLHQKNIQSIKEISNLFQALVNLFSVKPSSDMYLERMGLWSELFFMQLNGGFKFWISSWHSEPNRIFDFSIDNMRTEIKSTTKNERIHEFSHKQLVILPSEDIVIVSFLLQEDDTGLSLKSLINSAKKELMGYPGYIKLEKAIRKVGMNEQNEEGPKFNGQYATNHMNWFKATQIPRFTMDEPKGVTGTHYRSNLTGANQLLKEEIEDWLKRWKEYG